jgi:hypothetical protein
LRTNPEFNAIYEIRQLNHEALLDPGTTPQPEYVPQQAALFHSLAPHIGRATSIASDLQSAQLANALTAAALDALDWPVYALNSAGKLLLANAKGEAQLTLGSPYSLQGGVLRASSAQANSDLQNALRTTASQQACSFRAASGHRVWWVTAVPVGSHAGVTLLYLARTSGRQPSPAVLRQVLNFSEAEAEPHSGRTDHSEPRECRTPYRRRREGAKKISRIHILAFAMMQNPDRVEDWLRVHRTLMEKEAAFAELAIKAASGTLSVSQLDEERQVLMALRTLCTTVYEKTFRSTP